MEFSSGDRVLAIAPVADLRAIASQVALVVGIVDPEAVYGARAELRDLENVMIVPAEPDGSVPWKEDFFSVIFAPAAAEPTTEMLRVLATGGRAFVSGGPVQKR